jgi:MFS family permease
MHTRPESLNAAAQTSPAESTIATEPAAAQSPRELRRVASTALLGTSIEWYDFFLYGTAAALVFPALFFPASMPPLVAQFASFSTFAVGFFARPLGGVLFGNLGDRHGRKRALVIALLLMAVSTTCIGLLPSYEQVGWVAPLLLVLLRVVQGLAIGGQWAGAVLLVTENAPAGRRGFYGSFAQVGVPVGVVLANCAFLAVGALTSPDAFMAWGWRLPFIASVLLIGVAVYAQFKLEDTAAFRQLQATKAAAASPVAGAAAGMPEAAAAVAHAAAPAKAEHAPVLRALRQYPRQIALAAGAFIGVQVSFYICIAFVVAYGSGAGGLGLPKSLMLSAVLVGAAAMIPAIIGFAALSDRIGRRRLYLLGAVLSGAWSFALFPLVETGSLLWISVGIATAQVLGAMMYGPQAALLSEMFETRVRYSGATLGYQLGSIFGGGLAPSIATAILAETGSAFGISVYMAITCAITFTCMWLLPETHRNDMHAVSRSED